MRSVGWDAGQKEAFLRQQFTAQQICHATRFLDSEDRIILEDAKPIGRLHVAREKGEVRLVDIAILPTYRGRGIGTKLLEELQDQAMRSGLPLCGSVAKSNLSAVRFYQRLGFVVTGDMETHLQMEWRGILDGVDGGKNGGAKLG